MQIEQYNWLVDQLKNNTATWTIVAMHCPMYGVGPWGKGVGQNGQSLALRDQLQGIFAEYGVDIVLQGHDHVISKTYPINKDGQPQEETKETIKGLEYSVDPNGVIYVMNGPAGASGRGPWYPLEDALYSYAQASKTSSWADFAIDGNTLTVSVKYYENSQVKTYQEWGIKKVLS